MAEVIVFGLRDFASLAHAYLTHDSPHSVVAFSVTREHMPESQTFEGRPVVPFEDVAESLPPAGYQFFAPMSHSRMNLKRASIYEQIRAKGYELISYVHSSVTVYPGTEIGANCFIQEHNTIPPFTSIGDDVIMFGNNNIGHHSVVGDHVFISSHVVLAGHCTVDPYCFLGINSAIKDGVHLGEGSLVAMGACVIRDTEPWRVYQGNPAKPRKASSRRLVE